MGRRRETVPMRIFQVSSVPSPYPVQLEKSNSYPQRCIDRQSVDRVDQHVNNVPIIPGYPYRLQRPLLMEGVNT